MKVIKIVRHVEVEIFTRQGWELIATHEAERVDNVSAQTSPGGGFVNGCYQNATYEHKAFIVTDPLFVLSKDDEPLSREEVLTRQLADANAIIGGLRQAEEAAKRDLKKQFEHNETLAERNTALRASFDAEEGRRRKLEGDLAKIRAAIGDLRWKELVGQAQ